MQGNRLSQVPRHRLQSAGFGVEIPIMISAMWDEKTRIPPGPACEPDLLVSSKGQLGDPAYAGEFSAGQVRVCISLEDYAAAAPDNPGTPRNSPATSHGLASGCNAQCSWLNCTAQRGTRECH